MSSNGIHPQIISLLKLKDEGRSHMIKGQYYEALKIMKFINIEISREDRDKEIVKKILQEIATLNGFTYKKGSGRRNRIKSMSHNYNEWWETIFYILETKGYLSNEKYGYHDPSNGRKSE